MNRRQAKLSFFDEFETILLPIDSKELKLDAIKKISNDKKINMKEEFHITIVGFSIGEKLISMNIDFDKVKSIALKYDWNYILKDSFFYIEKDIIDEYDLSEKRRSVIQVVDVPCLELFYRDLNNQFDFKFITPFPHITLCTDSTNYKNKQMGIGIYSKNEFDDLNPERINVNN